MRLNQQMGLFISPSFEIHWFVTKRFWFCACRMQRKKGQFTSAKSSNEDSASNGSDWGSGQSWALEGTETQKPEAL